jgi:transposase
VVTPEGFPLAYEVLADNTSDKTRLRDFLKKIENQYGKAQRIWVMDRGLLINQSSRFLDGAAWRRARVSPHE